jgi:nitroimidazol reductase NimA-like FMN-containing flavoprotein (pyridoxamine 5'-phosphate oxidase superfamily)
MYTYDRRPRRRRRWGPYIVPPWLVQATVRAVMARLMMLLGHPSSRVNKLLSQPDVRIVATATILDGYVLALSSFSSSMNYRSAVLHGYTVPIGTQPGDDPEKDKNEAFARVTERTIPGRWDYARKPTPSEFKGTAIIRVIIDSAR